METATQTPTMNLWEKGAPNAPCKACGHQHERAGVVGGVVTYSKCKQSYVVKVGEDDRRHEQKRYCQCDNRS